MADPKKTCFIIMPISTPEGFVDKYRDGAGHFGHVLDCLFVPSVVKAGYDPIPPAAKGADLIHAEIIKNLETADLVLCDMSILNPNVFFEFGIRTSVNKPVCIVKDELTKNVPFDAGILNHHQYKSSLESWEVRAEIESLANHLRESDERSNGANTLWKYFGLQTAAQPAEGATGVEAKLDLLTLEVASLRRRSEIQSHKPPRLEEVLSSFSDLPSTSLLPFLPDDIEILKFRDGPTGPELMLSRMPKALERDRIIAVADLIADKRVLLTVKSHSGRPKVIWVRPADVARDSVEER